MEVSDGDISSLYLINFSQNRNDANKLEHINDTIEKLKICNKVDNIRLNLFQNTDLKNKQNPNKTLKIFDSFLKFGRFSGINN